MFDSASSWGRTINLPLLDRLRLVLKVEVAFYNIEAKQAKDL
jgi:hypothetical protein